VRSTLQSWRFPARRPQTANPDRHLLEAHRNLRELVEDTSIPAAVREELAAEFEEIESISQKLRKGEIHIAAFGRVGVGKSSLLNALLQRPVFTTSPPARRNPAGKPPVLAVPA
jgi:putative ribosome biogenesis GTPase RsgA